MRNLEPRLQTVHYKLSTTASYILARWTIRVRNHTSRVGPGLFYNPTTSQKRRNNQFQVKDHDNGIEWSDAFTMQSSNDDARQAIAKRKLFDNQSRRERNWNIKTLAEGKEERSSGIVPYTSNTFSLSCRRRNRQEMVWFRYYLANAESKMVSIFSNDNDVGAYSR